MSKLNSFNDPELDLIIKRIQNTESFLDKEYTIEEFEEEGLAEVIQGFLEAKKKAEEIGGSIRTELEYYPYTAGTKCLEITFIVESDDKS